MKAEHIVTHLKRYLPKQSTLFQDELQIASLVKSGTNAVLTTTAAHGAAISSTGLATVKGALAPVTITQIVVLDNVATVTTSAAHDLTENDKVDFSVAGNALAGTYVATSVPNRFTVKFSITAANQTVTGGQLYDGISRGYDGLYTVTATGANTLTYPLPFSGEDTPTPALVTNAKLVVGYRMSMSASVERALEAYTQRVNNDHWWLFVVLGPCVAGRGNEERSDAMHVGGAGVDVRQMLIHNFDVLVIGRATDTLAGATVRDSIHDIRTALFRSLVRASFPMGLGSDGQGTTSFVGDDTQGYDEATYAHRFTFQIVGDITTGDVMPWGGVFDPTTGQTTGTDVAFRDLEITSFIPVPDTANTRPRPVMTGVVNLDDAP